MPLRLILTALLLTIAGTAMGQIRVVASIAPYGDLVRHVGGEAVEVSVMLPAGASPHTFEPTPRDASELAGADLVVLNGGTDEWLHELAESVEPGIRVMEGLAVLEAELPPLDGHEEDGEVDHSAHAHPGVNPHVWLDPPLMAQLAEALGAVLADIDPQRAGDYRWRAAEASAALMALDGELRELLAPVQGAPFIPFHDAWPYFARRYGLDLIIEIEPFPGREPSPRYLADAVGAIRESGAPAIFNEAGLGDRAAQVLAAEAGVEVRTLDPLGEPGESYAELMRRNAATILDALAPWEPR